MFGPGKQKIIQEEFFREDQDEVNSENQFEEYQAEEFEHEEQN